MIKPRIVLSRCFCKPVRYDGRVVINDFVEKLKPHIDYIDFCPEIDIGLVTPRPPIIVLQMGDSKRLIQPQTGADLTERMLDYVEQTLRNINDIDGFLLKAKSPSCGVGSTRLYRNTTAIGKTYGFFAEGIKKKFPYLPLEDEIRLKNEERKWHFLARIFAFSELRDLMKNLDVKKLIDFHSRYEYLLMCYCQKYLKQLGQIVEDKKISVQEKFSKYEKLFYRTLQKRPSQKKRLAEFPKELIDNISF